MKISQEINLPENTKAWLWLTLLAVAGVILLITDMALGSVRIPSGDIIHILTGNKNVNPVWTKIVLDIRVPKAITAVIAGAALSVSGLQMQTLFRNPLAGPSVLGITSGASLGVAALMLGTGSFAGSHALRQLSAGSSWLIILASFGGSALAFFLIISISIRVKDNVVLLVIGMLLSSLIIAIVSIWQYFSEPEQIQDYLIWTFGSLNGVSPDQIPILLTVTIIGILLTFISSKSLNLLLLGENYASSMGVQTKTIKTLVIFSTSLLAGAVTGFCGPIGFIGIAVPHLCRALLNTSDHRLLVPCCCLAGAVMMLFCDILSQPPGYQTVLPINAVTSIFGSPVVIWVILQKINARTSFN